MDLSELPERLLYLVPCILSLSVHEWAHAYSASKLGDDTAERMGRLTLNPLAHIDPIGTLLLPLLGIPFGWAKPVPVNPTRFHRGVSMGTGMMITASAGPISNLILAVLCGVVLGVGLRLHSIETLDGPIVHLLEIGIGLNLSLAVFNLLPIPPLDGSRVVDGLIPYRLRPQWDQFVKFSPLVLVAVVFFGRHLLAGPVLFLQGLIVELMRKVGRV
jgi:Zn-dependent protease